MPTFDRPLTDDERDLMAHIAMWGSAGYPVRKVGSRHWSWDYRSLSTPRVYPTKREATRSFEAYMDVLRDCAGAEARRRALAVAGR